MKCPKNIIAVSLCRNCSGLSCAPFNYENIYVSFVLKRKKKNLNVLIKLELTNLVSIDTLYISIINKGLVYINSAL